MNADELIAILRQGEGPRVEFKSDFPRQADDIAKEMAALANSGGGILLMGVADDGKIPGVPEPDRVVDRLAGFADCLRVSPEIDKFQISKSVFVVYVRVHPCAPSFFRDRIYHRVGSSSVACTSHEQLERILSHQTSRVRSPSKAGIPKGRRTTKSPRKTRGLPRIGVMFERGVIKPGDTMTILDRKNSEAVVVDAGNVMYGSQVMSYNEWGQKVTGWVSLNIYKWAVLKGQTLDELR